MENKNILLNNNTQTVVLKPGEVYEVTWPPEHPWKAFKTIMRFVLHTSWDGGYVFEVLCRQHKAVLEEAHGFPRGDSITYGRNELRSARFKTSPALNILYGKK